MANNLLTQVDSTSEAAAVAASDEQLVNALMGKTYEEKPIWAELWEGIRDVFFPPKLPPLELTSKPIPVVDPLAVKANPWAIGISTTVNVSILLVLLFFVGKKIVETVTKPTMMTSIDVGDYNAPKSVNKAGGGGGGGDHSVIEASKGKLPKIEKDPVVPPQVQTFDKPKIAMPSAIKVQEDIKLPDNPDLVNIGMAKGPNVVLSNGTGGGGGMGSGSGGGLGSGNGVGYGPGSGWNTGGGLAQVGGRVSAPVPLFQPEAEFSDEARRAKYQGVCLVGLIVDAQGNPQNVHIVRALGMGLDEKAMEAVRKYKFKPAMRDGKTPVPVYVNVEVNFRLY
ncbi:MAG TPA: energy transducer TonB [Terracidiphilus sp.]|jgi:periplasmic protein TonB|nr:energy transducer TonB [Terracidiphilus sp.]